jgi:hypothetical protein
LDIPSDIQNKLCTEFQLLSIEAASDDDEDSPKAAEEEAADAIVLEDDDVRSMDIVPMFGNYDC